MAKIENPCYRCDERMAECHSNCEKYKAYKSDMEIVRKARASDVNSEVNAYKFAQREKAIRVQQEKKKHAGRRGRR